MSADKTKLESRVLTAAQAIAWWGSLFGGVLLFLHFFNIGYLPRFDIPSVLGVLAGVAGLGLILMLLITAILLLPGAAASFFAESGAIPVVPVRGERESLTEEERVGKRYALGALGLGAGIAAVLIAMVVLLGWLPALPWMIVFSAAFLLVVLLYSLAKKRLAWAARFWWQVMFHTIAYVFWWMWSALLLAFEPGAMTAMGDTWVSLFLLAITALLIHATVYGSKGEPWKLRAAVVGGLMIYAALSSGLAASSLNTLVRHLRLGLIEGAHLTVTSEGCAIVRAADANVTCSKVSAASTLYRIDGVDVVTRVGADTLLSVSGGLKDPSLPRFTLPNEEVRSVGFRRVARPLKKEADAVP